MLYFKLGRLLYTYKRNSIHSKVNYAHRKAWHTWHNLDQKYLHYSINKPSLNEYRGKSYEKSGSVELKLDGGREGILLSSGIS